MSNTPDLLTLLGGHQNTVPIGGGGIGGMLNFSSDQLDNLAKLLGVLNPKSRLQTIGANRLPMTPNTPFTTDNQGNASYGISTLA